LCFTDLPSYNYRRMYCSGLVWSTVMIERPSDTKVIIGFILIYEYRIARLLFRRQIHVQQPPFPTDFAWGLPIPRVSDHLSFKFQDVRMVK